MLVLDGRSFVRWFILLVTTVMVGECARAQCSNQWFPSAGMLGVGGASQGALSVSVTTLWDPDGNGPLQPVLVVGGAFSRAGSAVANNIAIHDPATGREAGAGRSDPPLNHVLTHLGPMDWHVP